MSFVRVSAMSTFESGTKAGTLKHFLMYFAFSGFFLIVLLFAEIANAFFLIIWVFVSVTSIGNYFWHIQGWALISSIVGLLLPS